MNFLETLAAEWYTWQGYFVRTNLKFGKRSKGGYTGEMDVAAFHPAKRELVHVETSMDADRWEERKRRFARKFAEAKAHWKELFAFPIESTRQIGIVGFGASGRKGVLGEGIEVKSLAEFVAEICEELRTMHPLKQAIPETLPVLRAMQFAVHWGRNE
jgi:hypothetical protein